MDSKDKPREAAIGFVLAHSEHQAATEKRATAKAELLKLMTMPRVALLHDGKTYLIEVTSNGISVSEAESV